MSLNSEKWVCPFIVVGCNAAFYSKEEFNNHQINDSGMHAMATNGIPYLYQMPYITYIYLY